MSEQLRFPAPEANDPEDVAWNLQTGASMWGRGEQAEAVRWVRRAAEAASDAGSDERALVLARAAADLTSALAIPPSITPPPVASAPATPMPAAVRPPPPPVAPLNPDEATLPRELPMMRRPPPRTSPDEKTVLDYSIPSEVAEAERKKPAPSRRPPPPSRSGPSAAPPPLRSSPSAAPPPVAPSSRSAPSAAPPPLRSSPNAAPASVADSSRSAPSAAPPPVSHGPPSSRSAPPTRSSPGASRDAHRAREALRVAVRPSPDDRTALVVHLLAEDEAPPPDAHEALLVALDPRAHLTQKKR